MLYIFLTISMIAIIVLLLYKEAEEWICGFSIFLGVMFFIMSVPCIFGVLDHQSLISDKKYVLSLKSEIETMRKAHYSEVKSGTLIGGSLDNVQQSKTLSSYIERYSDGKAEYNKKLAKCKYSESSRLFWWIGGGAFIDKKVQDLTELE